MRRFGIDSMYVINGHAKPWLVRRLHLLVAWRCHVIRLKGARAYSSVPQGRASVVDGRGPAAQSPKVHGHHEVVEGLMQRLA